MKRRGVVRCLARGDGCPQNVELMMGPSGSVGGQEQETRQERPRQRSQSAHAGSGKRDPAHGAGRLSARANVRGRHNGVDGSAAPPMRLSDERCADD